VGVNGEQQSLIEPAVTQAFHYGYGCNRIGAAAPYSLEIGIPCIPKAAHFF
jgi:hypothetical protein